MARNRNRTTTDSDQTQAQATEAEAVEQQQQEEEEAVPRTFAEQRLAAQAARVEAEDVQQPEIDTSRCITCGEESVYVDDAEGRNPVGYCGTHLPRHLRDKAVNEGA